MSALRLKFFTATFEIVTATSSVGVVDLLHDDMPPDSRMAAGIRYDMRRVVVFFTILTLVSCMDDVRRYTRISLFHALVTICKISISWGNIQHKFASF